MISSLSEYVTMTEKMGPDEEKSDFEFLAFVVFKPKEKKVMSKIQYFHISQ
jgi:hypothetical protein